MKQQDPSFTAVGTQTIQPPYKTFCHFLSEVNIIFLHDLAIMLPDVYPNELKKYVHTKTCSFILDCQNLEVIKIPFKVN